MPYILVTLDRPCVAGGVADHVRMNLEGQAGLPTGPFHHPVEAVSSERATTTFRRENERRRWLLRLLQFPQRPPQIALEALNQRYALGDIGRTEYLENRDDILAAQRSILAAQRSSQVADSHVARSFGEKGKSAWRTLSAPGDRIGPPST
jgi:hypothetical protein